MTLSDAARLVSHWAVNKTLIQEVRFFGSRVRCDNEEDSDLDIAIRLHIEDPDSALAYWMFKSEKWKKELSEILPWAIDIQWYHFVATPVIRAGIDAKSIRVFCRYG